MVFEYKYFFNRSFFAKTCTLHTEFKCIFITGLFTKEDLRNAETQNKKAY